MFATKRPKNKTSNYIITMDPNNIEKTSNKYLGKLRSNFSGTEFTLFDNGISYEKINENNNNNNSNLKNSKLRCEIGSILYETNILGTKGPRKMIVIFPDINMKNCKKIFCQSNKNETSLLCKEYKNNNNNLNNNNNNNNNSIMILENKSPKWNEQIGAYVLNFSGRVTMASVKNFQLVLPKSDNVILQFVVLVKINLIWILNIQFHHFKHLVFVYLHLIQN